MTRNKKRKWPGRAWNERARSRKLKRIKQPHKVSKQGKDMPKEV